MSWRGVLSQVGIVDQPMARDCKKTFWASVWSTVKDLWRWDGYTLAAEDSSTRRRGGCSRPVGWKSLMPNGDKPRPALTRLHHAMLVLARLFWRMKPIAQRVSRAAIPTAPWPNKPPFVARRAERNILAGRLETLSQAVSRHGEEAATASGS